MKRSQLIGSTAIRIRRKCHLLRLRCDVEPSGLRFAPPRLDFGGHHPTRKAPVPKNREKQAIEAVAMKKALERMTIEEREEAVEKGAIEKRGEVMNKTEEMKNRKAAERMRYKAKGKARVFLTEAEKLKLEQDSYLEWKKKQEADAPDPMSEEVRDPHAFAAKLFKQMWEGSCGKMGYGNFTDITTPFMLDSDAKKRDSLQVFSVKVSKLTGGLQWPLHVYGLLAIRDTYDHKRNIIFERKRENYQTLTVENPYLVLTGPMRAVMLLDRVVFDASLYARGTADSDDKELSLLAASCRTAPCSSGSFLTMRSYTSRLSTLDFKLGHIVGSVQATINMKVISGPPHGFYGEFVAFTDKIEDEIVLHKSGDEELHLAGDEVNLSRSVVSVGTRGKLTISLMARDGCVNSMGSRIFTPQEKGTSSGEIEVAGLCKFKVNVDWSLIPLAK